MGLDQYAYSAAKSGKYDEYYNSDGTSKNKPKDLAYWRKHPNLQGWMEKLAEAKGLEYDSFNGVELELTWEDLEMLEQDVLAERLPTTAGFFFGNDADEYYREHDLKFIREAKADLLCGLKVFYNSSW